MFDIGGWEFFLIVLLALVVIGPKDLPLAIRTVSGWIRRARLLAREFQDGLDTIATEAELEKVKADLASNVGLEDLKNDIQGSLQETIDPDEELRNTIRGLDSPESYPDESLSQAPEKSHQS
ncbi:MAG: Sec-independent protein translocase protein TatB [Rhodospirillaceae bacterium]